MAETLTTAFLSGALGGVIMVGVSAPFDLIKVRLQTSAYPAHVTTFGQALRHTVSSTGIVGLYRGVVPVLAGSAPLCALSFYGYQLGQDLTRRFNPTCQHRPSSETPRKLGYVEYGLAGSFSGVLTAPLIAPLERIKIILQTSKATLTDVVVNVKCDGLQRFFRGSGLTVVRDGVGNLFYFGVYETCADASFLGRRHPVTVLAGLACWMLIFPIDCIKSRYQGSSLSVKEICNGIRKAGWKSVYKGLSSTLLRAFPASAAFFGGVEIGKHLFN